MSASVRTVLATRGAAADGARDVQRRTQRRTAGEDEAAERREFLLELVDQLLEPDHIVIGDHGFRHSRRQLVGRIGELGAECKEVALNLLQGFVQRRVEWGCADQPEPRVQLVDLAVRVDARVVFLDP